MDVPPRIHGHVRNAREAALRAIVAEALRQADTILDRLAGGGKRLDGAHRGAELVQGRLDARVGCAEITVECDVLHAQVMAQGNHRLDLGAALTGENRAEGHGDPVGDGEADVGCRLGK